MSMVLIYRGLPIYYVRSSERRGDSWSGSMNMVTCCSASLSTRSGARSGDGSRGTPSSEQAVRYAVRSLGWVQVAEEDLTPERSSKAVNRCIVDLSLGRNNTIDAVGRWGDVSTPLVSVHYSSQAGADHHHIIYISIYTHMQIHTYMLH